MPRGEPPWQAEYNMVRAAGWLYDNDRLCWHHAVGNVWTDATRSQIASHLRAGTEVPTRPALPAVPTRSRVAQAHAAGWSTPQVAAAVARATVRAARARQEARGKLFAITDPAWQA